jgi:ubiquinone/menaquinone biosynthesis C-methylase UbiE
MTLKQEFNTWKNGYTEKMIRWVPYYQELIEALYRTLPAGFQPSSILDFGCGNGNGTAFLMPHFPNAQYTLLDASNEMLQACGERFAEKKDTQYVESYFQEADFPANSFDLVIAAFSLHHLKSEEKAEVFKKIYSWLRPGGVLTSSDLHATKRDPAYPQLIIEEWKTFATNQGTPVEEWDNLMDHHAKYDTPDAYPDQLEWLQAVGFKTAKVAWNVRQWGNVLAVK